MTEISGYTLPAALVAHGGGPTAVLNASLAGVVEECRARGVNAVHGALGGAAGILEGRFIDLLSRPSGFWQEAAQAPGSLLGSSRKRLTDEDFARMMEILQKREIRYVFLTGGNGTMEMASRLAGTVERSGFEASVIGIPKTIDNDLAVTDHSPGYASAARFFAHAIRDIGADNRALPGITVVEVLGRNAGWLAAATVLARKYPDDAPHLIYLPENPLSFGQLAGDVDRAYKRFGRVVVAVCEGQLDPEGQPFGADTRASGRAPLALNLAHVLSKRLSHELKVSARSEKPGLLGRSCAALASPVDREEAALCGRAAVTEALKGTTGKMVTLERGSGEAYRASTGTCDLAAVAKIERLFPANWMPAAATDNFERFREWLEPIAGKMGTLPRL